MKGDVSSDDDTSSEEEIEVFGVPSRNPPRPPPANEPVLDPFADDDVASTVADLSSGDAAIDAIDAISAAAAGVPARACTTDGKMRRQVRP